MPYKIAVATSDGENVNETFGSAEFFEIYEVSDGVYSKSERRIFQAETADISAEKCGSKGCGNSDGCGSGCSGNGGTSAKTELVADCRAVVCKKIGFHIQKQLEKKAISAFDVSCSVNEALEKITFYYNRIDRHESLRK
ncbi:MAG: hydrogenase [Ruminococcus flavefaciens]|nr:hydrogenase [Ruminococcus flavefaciens]MCM1229788.1 hydrogenase [Ruminococcus flavefaciens]